MSYRIINNPDLPEFDRFVQNHASGSFLQSAGWGDWQETLDKKAVRLQVLDTEKPEKILLQCQFLQTHLVGKLNYLYAPYGPLIAPELSLETQGEILGELVNYLKQAFSDSNFFRLEPKQDLLPAYNLQLTAYNLKSTPRIQPGKTLVVDLSHPADEILSGMHPKTRYNIKLAEKHGIKIQKEFSVTPGFGLYLEEVVGLLVQTARRQNFKTHSAAYYRRLIEFFSRGSNSISLGVYKATFQNRLLAAGLMLDFGLTRTYLFGGSSETNKNLMAPHLLHWQAMLDAKTRGLTRYDFWGLETSGEKAQGFARFKLGFGGQTVQYSEPRDIILRPTWYNIYTALRLINRKLLN